MDDRTRSCPNCGAAVSSSARFCVTCGIRLPETATNAGAPTQGGWRQPGEDVWIAEAPALDDESEQTLSDDGPQEHQETEDDTAPAIAVEPGEAAAEPESVDVNGPDDVIAIPPVDIGEPADAPDFVSDEPAADGDAATPMFGFGSWSNDAVSGSEDESIAGGAIINGEQVGPEGELAITSEDHSGLEGDATDQPGTSPGEENGAETSMDSAITDAVPDQSDDDADDFDPAGWVDTDDAFFGSDDAPALDDESESELMSYPTQPTTSFAADDRASALDRATSLLDELRGLMPHLAGPAAPSAPAVDLATLREQALAARGEQSSDHFAALREVVTEAVNRPRDIEVVLRLSQRIDDINALLNERDRLDSALNDLIGRLGE